jgi:hypothetical protein
VSGVNTPTPPENALLPSSVAAVRTTATASDDSNTSLSSPLRYVSRGQASRMACRPVGRTGEGGRSALPELAPSAFHE